MDLAKLFAGLICLVLAKMVLISEGRNAFTPYYVKTESIVCSPNPKMIVNASCRLKPINWQKTVAILDGDLVGVIRNASIHLQLFKYTNQFRPFLVNISRNACEFLETGFVPGGAGGTYAKIMQKVAVEYTSINHTCPYSGHVSARGLYLDARYMPFIVPSGRFKLNFAFYEGWPYEHIGTVEAIGSVIDAKDIQKSKRTA